MTFINNKNEILSSILEYLNYNNYDNEKINKIMHNFLRNIGNVLYITVMHVNNKKFFDLFINILKTSEKNFDEIAECIVEAYCEDEVITSKNELKGKNIYENTCNYSNN